MAFKLYAGGQQACIALQRVCTNSPAPFNAAELQAILEPVPVSELPKEEAEEDRHNFAQARDGAKLVAANKEAKKAAAVLDSDSDTFSKNECKADKWIILELSQVAKVDTLELSQVSNTPVRQWQYLLVRLLSRDCSCQSLSCLLLLVPWPVPQSGACSMGACFSLMPCNGACSLSFTRPEYMSLR